MVNLGLPRLKPWFLVLFVLKPWLIFVREHAKLIENIRCVGGEIITDIKTRSWRQQPKKFHRIMNVPESDARASFSSFSRRRIAVVFSRA